MGRGASAAARRWRLHFQGATLIGWGSHASIGALIIEILHRTAVYVTRMYGGVGGVGREASPYPDFPSGFYGTNLHSYLTRCGVDTVVITGNSTSGCVRATAIDAVSAGFRVIVPRQCVADRVRLTHFVNLFDIDAKYGDVLDVEEVMAAMQRLGNMREMSVS